MPVCTDATAVAVHRPSPALQIPLASPLSRSHSLHGEQALVRLVETTSVSSGTDVLIPNALACMHNCSLLPEALATLTTVPMAKALVPRVNGSSSLSRRPRIAPVTCGMELQ